ncbi:MAG TPA: hybrid sensor histidine kinase/response regulator, partial [Cyanobacteria bacterium UBA11369]|nr:hybrid sensor histidine kinase/response regulator [Cyanobacteria bacterium UBA11371]HBE53401.1 hybrid sensor histidine kinase/response regulator [Cyanobacteria bacterium UBA11369]
LVVDDTKENRLLLLKLLEPIGFEVKEAENGEQALELWENWQPHLIWIDTRMPVMDGMEASKQIRLRETRAEQAAQASKTIIIALTASAFEERRGEILAAGCDDFVRKPFPEQLIFAKMAEYLGVRYVYEDLPQLTLAYSRKRYYASEKPVKFLLQQLAQMPKTWIEQLYQAANEVNEDLVAQLIEQIPESYSPLTKALRDLLDDFRLDIIVRLTHSIIN